VRQLQIGSCCRQVELDDPQSRVGHAGGGSDPRVVGAYRLESREFAPT
jgi:hypothetical protein